MERTSDAWDTRRRLRVWGKTLVAVVVILMASVAVLAAASVLAWIVVGSFLGDPDPD